MSIKAIPLSEETTAPDTNENKPVLNHYEAKQEARRARLEARAKAVTNESNMVYNRAKSMASAIPMGQPILVGHYSERRDRNYRNKIHTTYGKAFALQDKAESLARRAENVGTGGISSDDPDAISKLRAQVEALEADQNRMKKANALLRKGDDAGLAALGYTSEQITELKTPDFARRTGYPPYRLTNNNANIRRIKDRIAELEKIAERADKEETGNGYIYREDTTENRVMFIFEGKPEKHIREYLSKHAFKWSPTREAWVRKLTGNALFDAKYVRKFLDSMQEAK